MRAIFVLATFVAVAVQVYADDLDDLRQQYVNELKNINEDAIRVIEASEGTLDETDLYMDRATSLFVSDGGTRIGNQQAVVDDQAAQLTLDAISNNKPASVLTCINTRREDGLNSLSALTTPFESSLTNLYIDSSSGFLSQRNTISLVKSQTQALLDANTNTIMTCVVAECFENNIASAVKQYDNLKSSVNSIRDDVKSARASYNDQAINLVDNLRDDAQSAVDDAVKKMGKC